MYDTKSPLAATLPVLFGYIPLGIAFGMLFADLGYPWYTATLMSITVYAGAAQFMAVGLLAAGAGLLEIAAATLLVNARHIFYGFSMATRYVGRGPKQLYLIFGLTDETYSLLTSSTPATAGDTRFYLKVTALNQAYWVIGSTIGALLGTGIEFDTRGMEFTLTALFVVLLIEQARAVREARPFLVATLCAAAALLLVGSEHMLLASLGLATALLFIDARRTA